MTITGMRLEAVDKRNGKIYDDSSFDIVRLLDGCFYGVINVDSTERQFLELRLKEDESK